MSYESLLIEAQSKVDVYEMDMLGQLKGLYKDGIVWIRKGLSDSEKTGILAEEIGHHETSYGDILSKTDLRCRQQELRARQWAYERLVPLSAIVRAHKANVRGSYEIADYLSVTEDFLQASISRYHDKYGTLTAIENYIIFFDPLRVVEVIC